MAQCVKCALPAREGCLTCTKHEPFEGSARAAAHTERRLGGAGGRAGRAAPGLAKSLARNQDAAAKPAAGSAVDPSLRHTAQIDRLVQGLGVDAEKVANRFAIGPGDADDGDAPEPLGPPGAAEPSPIDRHLALRATVERLAARGAEVQGHAPPCGEKNRYMNVACTLAYGHDGDVHVSGKFKWGRGGRPYEVPADELALYGEQVRGASDGERLSELTQVLLTARSQMLGLGEGLKEALAQMPRSIDRSAVQGLVTALTAIVATLSKHEPTEAEAGIRKEARLGADRLTAAHFEPGPSDRERHAADTDRNLPLTAGLKDVLLQRTQRRLAAEREDLAARRAALSPLTEKEQTLLMEGVQGRSAISVRPTSTPGGSLDLRLGPSSTLDALLDEMKKRVQFAEAKVDELGQRLRVYGEYVDILWKDSETRGRNLSQEEWQTLRSRVVGRLGLGRDEAFGGLDEENWLEVVNDLESLGLLGGPHTLRAPTLAGYRYAIWLLSLEAESEKSQ
jgi:hypothetical protein